MTTQYANKDDGDWVIDGVRHHLVIANNHSDGSPASSFLLPCGKWCHCDTH